MFASERVTLKGSIYDTFKLSKVLFGYVLVSPSQRLLSVLKTVSLLKDYNENSNVPRKLYHTNEGCMEEQDNSYCATHNKTNQIVLSIHGGTIQRYLIQPFQALCG